MVAVKREKHDTDEKMIRRFIKKVKKFGIIEQFLSKRFYIKPSDQRRIDKKRQIAECKKRLAKEKQ